MPLLPTDHVTLPFAATYLAAAILHKNYAPETKTRAPVPFDSCGFTIERRATAPASDGFPRVPPRRVQRHDLVSTSLRVHAGPGPDARDPTGFEVSVTFEERNGQTLYTAQPGFSPATVKKLELTLAPPVVGCLSPTRLRAGLNARGLVAIGAPLPDSIQVRATPFEERLVTRYRQVLAKGLLGAVLVDGKGRSVSIPASYWREDGAAAAFVEPRPVLMNVDGQDVRGHVCVDLSELRTAWQDAFAALPVSPELAEAELPATSSKVGTAPLLDFAVYLARTLGIVDGRGPDGKVINEGNLQTLIEKHWEIYGKLGEKPTQNRLDLFTAILRRHDEKRGPKDEYSILK